MIHMTEFTRTLENEEATLALGRALAHTLTPGMVVYLTGELGAGKTTLARGVLRGLGHEGRVKSPTFALVEVYEFSRLYLYHFDFYRFTGSNPQELREAGFREYFNSRSVCLVEWPEKAAGLPAADLRIELHVAAHLADSGRNVSIFADSEAGNSCLKSLHMP
jgi:tRNA threonylcarbamoyladenosine biosynthesis protein TsaE